MLRVKSRSVEDFDALRKERAITPERIEDVKKAFLEGIDKAWRELILRQPEASKGQLVVSRDEVPPSVAM